MPARWVPRAGILVAFRMKDAGLTPRVPRGAMVLVDQRPLAVEKLANRLAAVWIQGKGLRLRQIVRLSSGRYLAQSLAPGNRGAFPFRPERGDRIIGRLRGVVAPL